MRQMSETWASWRGMVLLIVAAMVIVFPLAFWLAERPPEKCQNLGHMSRDDLPVRCLDYWENR